MSTYTSTALEENEDIQESQEAYECTGCKRSFKTKRGLKQHQRSCTVMSTQEDQSHDIETQNLNVTSNVVFQWGEVDGKDFIESVEKIYEKIVYWKKNLFLLPSGKAGKTFIDHIVKLLNSWVEGTALQDIAFKAVMIMPSLLLQKPSKNSKAKEHLNNLERRMELWEKGYLMELLHEGETIQKYLKDPQSKREIGVISKKFAALMKKGNVNAAINLLSENMKNGILPLNNETLKQLKLKHPQPKKADKTILLPDTPERIHPVRFELIDADLIKKAATKTRGGSGPSGMDADGWRRILLSKYFGESSSDLCKTLANVAKKLSTEDKSLSLEAFLACRLIPLDKNPGLRPIGVGEVLRRIIGKVIVSVVRNDIISSVGSLQVCAGHEAGCEAAIHAMHTIFEEENTEAVLLVDAANAFNSVNREAFLHNIFVICPAIAIYVKNCYMIPSRMFVIGGFEISSSEGTTQGDPTVMAIYAIAVIPLVLMIIEIVTSTPGNTSKMVAYADDFTAGGTVKDLQHWWKTLCELGPKFGYYPEATKSWLIVKENNYEHAKAAFKSTKIKITSTGQRHLGAVIGSTTYKEDYMNEKINKWIKEIQLLSEIGKIEPQCALSCFTSGYKHKLNYCMRTIPNVAKLLKRLDDVITKEFLPAITGGIKCSSNERKLLSLPPKLGGLGIPIFSEIADFEYSNSRLITETLTMKVIYQERRYEEDPSIKDVKNKITKMRQQRQFEILHKVRNELTEQQLRLNDLNQENGASIWISSLPLEDEGYVITKQLFWDLIRIRYGWELLRLPETCVCGSKFNLQHALSCKKGGFVTIRHNQIRNITAKLLNEICSDVQLEPQLQKLSGEQFEARTANKSEEARLDISARGFWCSGQKALFDVRVFNPMAMRYRQMNLSKCYSINENEKKRQYNERVLQVEHATFTPLVMSSCGGFGRECARFYSKLAEEISEKRQQPYSVVCSWIKRKIVFSLIKSIGLCLRGSRSINNHVSIESDPVVSEVLSKI